MGWDSDPNKKVPDIKKLREQIGIEPVPYVQQAAESTEKREAHANPDLVLKYAEFKKAVGFEKGTIYHPCSGSDISPSETFREAKVVYADMDVVAMHAVSAKGLEAHIVDVKNFNPGPVDVLILLNPQIGPEVPASFVKADGYVVCNDYHATASTLYQKGFELRAIIRPTGKGYLYDNDSPEKYFQSIDTDEELRAAPFSWGSTNHEAVERDIKKLTTEGVALQGSSLVEQYKTLLNLLQKGEVPGSWSKLGDEWFRQEDALIIQTSLPRKKGVADDLFVFQKRVTEN